METKQAYIIWTHPNHKDKKLPVGTHYYPHIVCVDDPKQEHWSICFDVTEGNQKDEGIIELTMLVDNDETRTFFDALMPKTKFVLLEGFTEVAQGFIL